MSEIDQRLKQLQTLLKLKESDKQQAMKQLAEARHRLIHLTSQLERMNQYRQDYQKQIEIFGKQGCSINRMRSRVLFIQQIDQGIIQVNHQIATAAKLRDKCEKTLLEKQKKVQSVEKLIEAGEREKNRLINRLEQKENDEYANKQWYNE